MFLSKLWEFLRCLKLGTPRSTSWLIDLTPSQPVPDSDSGTLWCWALRLSSWCFKSSTDVSVEEFRFSILNAGGRFHSMGLLHNEAATKSNISLGGMLEGKCFFTPPQWFKGFLNPISMIVGVEKETRYRFVQASLALPTGRVCNLGCSPATSQVTSKSSPRFLSSNSLLNSSPWRCT